MLPLLLLAQHPRRLDVCGALFIGAVKQADDAEENRLGRLDGTPALGGGFVAVLVLFGRVQDGDAELAVLVDVGVERDGILKGELGRHVRVVFGENQSSTKVASCNHERPKSQLARVDTVCLNAREEWQSQEDRDATHRRSICSRR